MINGSTLTSEAETLLKNPTFLAAEPVAGSPAATAGVTAGRSGLWSLMAGSGALPWAAKALPWVGGAVVANEICNAIFDACIQFGASEADPTPPSLGWQWTPTPVRITSDGGLTVPMDVWYTRFQTFTEYSGCRVGGLNAYPASTADAFIPSKDGSVCWYSAESRYDVNQTGVAIRHGSRNRTYSAGGATDNGSVPNATGTIYCPTTGAACSSTPYTREWPTNASSILTDPTRYGLTQAQGDAVGEHIAASIRGSGVDDPYIAYTRVPDCDMLAYDDCADLMESVDLVPSLDPLDWRTAVIEEDAGAVIALDPASGSRLETGTTIVITHNPDESGMPLLVPEPLEGETYADYIARLAPGLDPRRTIVAAEFTDPTTGPNGVIRTDPGAGSRADPATSTEVEVFTNSPEAPSAAGAWTAPPIPAVDLSPLAGIAIGCNDFPFGIFCWVGDGLTDWGASGTCPEVNVPVGTTVDRDNELPFDLCQFEPAMEIIRPILILVAAFSLAYLFAAAAMGFGGGNNDD